MSLLQEVFQITQTDSLLGASKCLASGFRCVKERATTLEDLVAAAGVAGVSIRWEREAPFEGRYLSSKGREEITLVRSANPERLRFTLAHELGHMLVSRLLGREMAPKYRSATLRMQVAEEERLANAIAAEILMPANRFGRFFVVDGVTFESLEKARRFFQTSFSAALRRVSEVARRRLMILNVIPAHIFDPEENCIVDDATIISPDEGPKMVREQICIVSAPTFTEIKRARRVDLVIKSPLGLTRSIFDVRTSKTPCQNADLLAAL
jgi:Zn-dependent peptidase ImmA (M78 family)